MMYFSQFRKSINEDAGHFANAVDPDGIIRINH